MKSRQIQRKLFLVASALLILCVLSDSTLIAQTDNPFGETVKPGKKTFNMFVFANSRLQRELEVTPEQRRSLFELKFECEERHLDLSEEIEQLESRLENTQSVDSRETLKDAMAKLVTARKSLTTNYESQARETILLPHQLLLIERMALKRYATRAKGFLQSLPVINEHFEIKKTQADRMNAIVEKCCNEINESILSALQDAKREVLEEFSDAERKEIEIVFCSHEHRLHNSPKRLLIDLEKYYWKPNQTTK